MYYNITCFIEKKKQLSSKRVRRLSRQRGKLHKTWDNCEEKLRGFINEMNEINRTIKFTAKLSKKSINNFSKLTVSIIGSMKEADFQSSYCTVYIVICTSIHYQASNPFVI